MASSIQLLSSARRWQVLHPAIYLISVLPGLFWSVVLPDKYSRFDLAITTLSVVLIQHGVNVLNDFIDWKKGADSEKEISWVHLHHLNLRVVQFHGLLSFILGISLGCLVVVHHQSFKVLYVALPLVALGYSYNASQWTLSYTALGEWVTGLCYGPGVFGCMGYLFEKKITTITLLGSLAFGFLAVSVLFSHQPPQILTDFLSGKSSFAVRHGAKRTFFVSKIFSALALVFLSTLLFLITSNSISVFALFIFEIFLLFRIKRLKPSPKIILDSFLWLGSFSLILKLSGGLS